MSQECQTTKQRYWYACLWPYGRAWGDDGTPIRYVSCFDSRSARDAWVADRSTPYIYQADFREALLRSECSSTESEYAEAKMWEDELVRFEVGR